MICSLNGFSEQSGYGINVNAGSGSEKEKKN
jgi:hypothetical protein